MIDAEKRTNTAHTHVSPFMVSLRREDRSFLRFLSVRTQSAISRKYVRTQSNERRVKAASDFQERQLTILQEKFLSKIFPICTEKEVFVRLTARIWYDVRVRCTRDII